MIDKADILNNITQIDTLYQNHIGDNEAPYYSKLAVLEVCGWIEESMDNIAQGCAQKHLKETKNLDFVKKDIIKRTTSFEYDQHFRNMLMRLVGMINIERLEQILDLHKFTKMTSSLSALKQRRDELAHTYIKGTTLTIDAPSVTKDRFQNVYEGLKDIESCIRNMTNYIL